MSEPIQFALHPDADQLAAFAERALPLHERERTLAHLATCADCRRVVFLAEEATPVEALPVPAAAGRRWFTGWNLVWPAVAALAGMVALTLHLRNAPTVEHPPPAVITGSMQTPVQAPAPVREETQALPSAPVRPVSARPPAEAKIPDRSPAIVGGLSVAPKVEDLERARQTAVVNGYVGQNQQGANQQALSQQAPKLYGPSQQNQSSPTVKRFKVLNQDGAAPAAIGAEDSVSLADAATGQLAVHRAAVPVPIATAAPSAKPTAAAAGAAMAAAAPQAMASEQQVQVMAAPPPPPPPAPQQKATQEITANSLGNYNGLGGGRAQASSDAATINSVGAMKPARTPMLPSRLPALSSVANGERTVAVDSGGSVFLSKDSGQTWKAVGVKWAGRPMQVSLAASSWAGKPAFELRTDTGVVWISNNGQTWKRQ